jgi:hypothetical protein
MAKMSQSGTILAALPRHKDVAVRWCTWNRGKVLIWTFLDYQSSSLGHPNSELDRSAVPERKNLGNI